MACTRLNALRSAGADVVAVCARDLAKGRRFADRNRVPLSVDNLPGLLALGLDAAVVEVPHQTQDRVVEQLLLANVHVLAGGPLASTWDHGRKLVDLARGRGLVLETGYEARYSEVWEFARDWVRRAEVGAVTAIDTVALFDQPLGTWYTSRALSGGVAITHLTYCFLNPLRWILGAPVVTGATCRSTNPSDDNALDGAMYSVSLQYPGGVICSMLGGYMRPPSVEAWSVTFLAEHEALRIVPGDNAPSFGTRYHRDGVETLHWPDAPFVRQAEAFLAAISSGASTRAAGYDSLDDLATAEQIEKLCDEGTCT